MAFETVDITNSSGTQSINLPGALIINDDKVYLKKLGNVIYIIPFHNPWQNFINSLSEFSSDFMNFRDQPPSQPHQEFD